MHISCWSREECLAMRQNCLVQELEGEQEMGQELEQKQERGSRKGSAIININVNFDPLGGS